MKRLGESCLLTASSKVRVLVGEEWERIIQNLQRETTAKIMLRSAHIDRGEEKKDPIPVESPESLLLRRLTRKYGCEFVECRKEWLQYLHAHDLHPRALRSDGIHLNQDGCALMAQLYERHFRPNAAAQPWRSRVRR